MFHNFLYYINYISDVIKKQMPKSVNEPTVWLGGMDAADEGHWVWTSAGNLPLAKDLVWGLGRYTLV